MISATQLQRNILNGMRVELAEEFDRNFERKAFFSDKWKPRANPYAKGSLLVVTGTLRRSIKAEVRGNGVRFSSAVPYAAIHNEGGRHTQLVRAHTRRGKGGKRHPVRAHPRTCTMPQRQFVGGGSRTQAIIRGVVADNMTQFINQLTKTLKK